MMPDTSLVDQLRARTASLHIKAERTGIIADILARSASREGYALLLRNLLPVYQCLESTPSPTMDDREWKDVFCIEVRRAEAIERDLDELSGRSWRNTLPVVPATRSCVERLEKIAETRPSLLVAHAYVRYLGDLNGGQIMRRLLAQSLGLEDSALAFHRFPLIADIGSFRTQYRTAIQQAMARLDADDIADEAVLAFEFNVAISSEVQSLVSRTAATPVA